MSRMTIAAFKFVGTTSLGLLTGIHFSTSFASIKAILTLPSAPSAQRSFTTLSQTLSTITTPLSILSTTTLVASFFLSPSYKKHPYLLMTAITPLLSIGWSKFQLDGVERTVYRLVEDNGDLGVNGEEVKKGMEEYEVKSWVNVGLSGLGFILAVVGVWGDSV